jgi:hypothetical protein
VDKSSSATSHIRRRGEFDAVALDKPLKGALGLKEEAVSQKSIV